jgi:hypothetical protein
MDPDAPSREPGSTRDGDVDPRLGTREQAVQTRGRDVRKEAARAACHDSRHPKALDREVGAAECIHPSVHWVEPANRYSVAHASATDPERPELPKPNHSVLTLGQREKPAFSLAPIFSMVELRSSIRRKSAMGGDVRMVAEIACRLSTREARS